MFLFTILFICGIIFIAGLLNYSNILILLMYLELLLLSVNLIFQYSTTLYDHANGGLFVILIITIAACESALGLALAVLSHKFKSDLFV